MFIAVDLKSPIYCHFQDGRSFIKEVPSVFHQKHGLNLTSIPPNPNEFEGGKKRFDTILSQIREKQKHSKQWDKEHTPSDTSSDKIPGEDGNTPPPKITNKRHSFRYGYPIQRKSRQSIDQNSSLYSSRQSSIHSDMTDPKRLQMGCQIDKSMYSDKNLSRQYSVTTDDVATNSISDSSKAVTKSFAVSNKGTIK